MVGPTTAFCSNRITFSPAVTKFTVITIGTNEFMLPPVNKKGQSPFMQVAPGVYNISAQEHEGYKITKAKAYFQTSTGSFSPLGTWDGKNTITGVKLVKGVPSFTEWAFTKI